MSNNKPFFSFVIPTYNRARDLHFALHCILRQRFSDFEIIISDNCSTDSTASVVHQLMDRRIRYFRNKKNIDVISNIKKAMKYIRGKYIFFHSDDDILLYTDTLNRLHTVIQKYNPGYTRINYMCLTSDKKRIFDFRINKVSEMDKYLAPNSDNKKVVSFILGTDASFITGLIVKNNLPRDISVIVSEPFWAMKMLFFNAKKFGAYFIEKPYIIASMSEWRVREKGTHPLYTLVGGRLASENYLDLMKEKFDIESYTKFLHDQLMGLYVYRFPAVKLCVGNNNLLRLASRVRQLDKSMGRSIFFWVHLLFALTLPMISAKLLKSLYYFFYMRLSRQFKSEPILDRLNALQQEMRINQE